jgi:LysR family transcriptional activator of mexEF-oprN operon
VAAGAPNQFFASADFARRRLDHVAGAHGQRFSLRAGREQKRKIAATSLGFLKLHPQHSQGLEQARRTEIARIHGLETRIRHEAEDDVLLFAFGSGDKPDGRTLRIRRLGDGADAGDVERLEKSGAVGVALQQIQSAVLQGGAFEPATAERIFRVGLADSIEVAVIPGLIERLQDAAPHVSLRLRSTNRMSILEELDTGHLDLGIGVFDQGQTHHKRRQLYSDSFLCLFSSEQLDLAPPISLEDYLRWPHMLTTLADDTRGAVDEALAKHKLRRNIIMTTPGFLAVPFVVRRARVITTMPSRLARYFSEAFGLVTSPLPIDLPSFTISLLWHASFDHDPGHLWLRQTVAGLVSEDNLEL